MESPGAPDAPTGPTPGGEPPAPPPPPPPPAPPEPAADYPVQGTIERQDEYARFLPLVKWLLAIPHYIVLLFLWIAAAVVVLVTFFAVIITGRYPRGMFDFVVGVYRWTWRVTAYVLLMSDPYPPFTLQEDPAYPAHFDIEYPEEGVARWRPLVHWLLIIPYAIIASILFYLTELMAFFAFFTIIFTKRYPEGLFKIALVGLRWQARSNAYTHWLVTKYPPFVWD
jgi:uncharacterized protein DUF4389